MLAHRVLKTILREGMVRPGDRVLVGLSGGPDSVALTRLLLQIRDRLPMELVVAHLNHGLRPSAGDDEAFCRDLARELGLEFVSRRVDVARLARSAKRSIEDQGRRSRYAFLEERAAALGCRRIAVGHTLDDQAETFLLRLLRGSGTKGLSGVHPVVEGTRIRPLLDVRRREVLDYLSERGLRFRVDESNRDPAFTRNRLRLETIPHLEAAFNPRLLESLASSASLLRDEEEFMEVCADAAFAHVATEEHGRVGLSASELRRTHPAIRRRVVRRAIEKTLGKLVNVGRLHVESVLALAEGSPRGREAHLPGLVCERSFDDIWFVATRDGKRRPSVKPGYNGFEHRLAPPARVRIPELGGTLRAELLETSFPSGIDVEASVSTLGLGASGNAVVVGLAGGPPELRVRSPRPGDKFRPLGAPGKKSLTRYLMERKVARRTRSRIPLVVRPAPGGTTDEILWVAGHGISESSRLRRGGRAVRLEWLP